MKQNKLVSTVLTLVMLLLLSLVPGAAQGPENPQAPGPQEPLGARIPTGSAFTYQGRLKDNGGSPIDDTCDFTFSLWDDASAGSQIGSDSTVTGVSVSDGYFAALVNPGGEFGPSAFDGEARWLQIAVQCTGDANPITLDPRQPLTAAPYAVYAEKVGPHDHWGESWSGSGTGLTLASADSNGLFGQSAGDIVAGVYGYNSGSGYGVFGRGQSGPGVYGMAPTYGLYGLAIATSGFSYGVYGRTESTQGCGTTGYASATDGTTYGVYGLADSASGRGVYGHANATSGETYGVYGHSSSSEGIGVYGYASATSGEVYGVYGRADFPGSVGVYGTSSGHGVEGYSTETHNPATGVSGIVESEQGTGVFGSARASTGNNRGVYGVSSSTDGTGVLGIAGPESGTTYGVRGTSYSPSGYGVYYTGGIGGTGLQSTVVDTPAYGWRHLYNGASTEPLFEEVGSAQLVDGHAVVTIDPIFAQTVNLAEPYQVFLTPLGDCGLYVAEKTPSTFTVRALDGKSCSIAFDYRIVAKRLGYEDVRLSAAAAPPAPQDDWEGGE